MTTATVSFYVSEKLQEKDLAEIFEKVSRNLRADLKMIGFENPSVDVRKAEISTAGNKTRVLVENLSGISADFAKRVGNTIRYAFNSEIDPVEFPIEINLQGSLELVDPY